MLVGELSIVNEMVFTYSFLLLLLLDLWVEDLGFVLVHLNPRSDCSNRLWNHHSDVVLIVQNFPLPNDIFVKDQRWNKMFWKQTNGKKIDSGITNRKFTSVVNAKTNLIDVRSI